MKRIRYLVLVLVLVTSMAVVQAAVGQIGIQVSASAKAVCSPQFSHELEVSWTITGVSGSLRVTITITGPDGKTQTFTRSAAQGSIKVSLNYPQGGSVQVQVRAQTAGGSATGSASVTLTPCPIMISRTFDLTVKAIDIGHPDPKPVSVAIAVTDASGKRHPESGFWFVTPKTFVDLPTGVTKVHAPRILLCERFGEDRCHSFIEWREGSAVLAKATPEGFPVDLEVMLDRDRTVTAVWGIVQRPVHFRAIWERDGQPPIELRGVPITYSVDSPQKQEGEPWEREPTRGGGLTPFDAHIDNFARLTAKAKPVWAGYAPGYGKKVLTFQFKKWEEPFVLGGGAVCDEGNTNTSCTQYILRELTITAVYRIRPAVLVPPGSSTPTSATPKCRPGGEELVGFWFQFTGFEVFDFEESDGKDRPSLRWTTKHTQGGKTTTTSKEWSLPGFRTLNPAYRGVHGIPPSKGLAFRGALCPGDRVEIQFSLWEEDTWSPDDKLGEGIATFTYDSVKAMAVGTRTEGRYKMKGDHWDYDVLYFYKRLTCTVGGGGALGFSCT